MKNVMKNMRAVIARIVKTPCMILSGTVFWFIFLKLLISIFFTPMLFICFLPLPLLD